MRWYSGRAAMDLSDVAFGLTGWYPGRDGVAYRLAGRTSRIYLPAAYKSIAIPLRATEPHREVELRDPRRRCDRRAEAHRDRAWQVIGVPLPAPSSSARFRALDLEVVTPALTPRVLFIGRDQAVLTRRLVLYPPVVPRPITSALHRRSPLRDLTTPP